MIFSTSGTAEHEAALNRARSKAYRRLLPLLFVSYMIAYVDRQNVAVAKLTMTRDLPGFDNAVIGFGAGIFFLGYFLLEIPGTLMVERWSARKWICRIMITWGVMAGLTAAVTTPWQFYTVRFLLGLAEAGFFPGVVVYLTHWFPSRDRARALATFLVATPMAQIISPKISNWLLAIGHGDQPPVLGMVGWQWVYVFWAIPAVVLGFFVYFWLVDRPKQAKWLTAEEGEALESELERERAETRKGKRMTVIQALKHPKVLLLALVYFCTVTGSYGIEFFMPSILKSWYAMDMNQLTWLIMLPPAVAMVGQLFMGWSSDRFKERRWHAVLPIVMGSAALGIMPHTQGNLVLTMVCLMLAFAGFKSYMPAFWALPSLFLTESAAAGSIGLINSIGNLGGFLGPYVLGTVEKVTGSFVGGLYYLCCSMLAAAAIIFSFGLGKKEPVSTKLASD
ncbi:MFS transporter [Prosthecobacter sp.]|uniref:MFS transporter n=1 Tax=Prosthecobacter sp. TaxID=1965333 RepID=UPI002AB9F484|nr:MFS transporter [Prosthecobacter sp.]MDZ4405862.1 MFS transporter [Prosthecobacter sp.]